MFPAMKAFKADEGMVLVKGRGTGGTTTIATGNALRLDQDLKEIGVDLDEEFARAGTRSPHNDGPSIALEPDDARPVRRLRADGTWSPRPCPRWAGTRAARCAAAASSDAPAESSGTAGSSSPAALESGVTLRTGVTAERVVIKGGEAVGLDVRAGLRREFVPADLVVLAAGGFGTPALLERSGIPCVPRLFVDPVLCVAAKWKGAHQDRDLPMPFYVRREGYILAPYFDPLSYFFNREWRPPAGDILSLMIKLADEPEGRVEGRRVSKPLTGADTTRLAEASDLCREVFDRLGVREDGPLLRNAQRRPPGRLSAPRDGNGVLASMTPAAGEPLRR